MLRVESLELIFDLSNRSRCALSSLRLMRLLSTFVFDFNFTLAVSFSYESGVFILLG